MHIFSIFFSISSTVLKYRDAGILMLFSNLVVKNRLSSPFPTNYSEGINVGLLRVKTNELIR